MNFELRNLVGDFADGLNTVDASGEPEGVDPFGRVAQIGIINVGACLHAISQRSPTFRAMNRVQARSYIGENGLSAFGQHALETRRGLHSPAE